MDSKPIIIEEELKAPIEIVWRALTDRAEISQWFFEVDEFEPEVGFNFSFYDGGEEQKYQHICKVLEVETNKKLSYSWTYPDLDGYSTVTFELLSKNNGVTILKFSHEGIESFPQDNPLFTRQSFLDGWRQIISISLKEYVENI